MFGDVCLLDLFSISFVLSFCFLMARENWKGIDGRNKFFEKY